MILRPVPWAQEVLIGVEMSEKREQLRIFDISRMSMINGPGLRSLIHFKGCNLRCSWCSTPESQEYRQQLSFWRKRCIACRNCINVCSSKAISYCDDLGISIDREKCTECMLCAEQCCSGALSGIGKDYSADEIFELIKRDQNLYHHSGGGVTFSGGEVLMSINDEMMKLLSMLKREGISVGFDTAGYVSQKTIEKVMLFADFFLWDVKLIDSEQHKKYTGVHNELILSNLRYIDDSGIDIYFRCPIIPGVNDYDVFFEQIAYLASQIKNLKEIHLFAFHKLGESRYESIGLKSPYGGMREISSAFLEEKRVFLEEKGHKVKII